MACKTNQNENHAELDESDEETLRDDDEGGEEGEIDSGDGNGADEHESRSKICWDQERSP